MLHREPSEEVAVSEPQWENLPATQPGVSQQPSWQGFSGDPRPGANRGVRASDTDRGYATWVIDQAMADGRLTAAERLERLTIARQARTLGELLPLVADLVPEPAAPAPTRTNWRSATVRSWLLLAALFNAIWLMTVLTTGRLLYYWPMWPMLGTAVAVVVTLLASGRQPATPPPPPQRPPALPPGTPPDLR